MMMSSIDFKKQFFVLPILKHFFILPFPQYPLQATDEGGFPAIAYEFVKEALLLYESEISDSKVQVQALTEVIGTLLNCQNFPTEDYEALIHKVRWCWC